MDDFVLKKKVNYWWYATLLPIEKKIVKWIMKTSITPNMITLFNLMVIFPLVGFTAYKKYYILIALLVQIYMFLDNVDGDLARNKHMQSELGAKLDVITDTIFFTFGYLFIGLSVELPIYVIIIAIMIQHIYGIVATYYIVPKIRNIKNFEHTKIKKYFAKKNIMFGMDTTLEMLITSVLLLMPIRRFVFIVCPVLWVMDMFYRIYELNWINRKNM